MKKLSPFARLTKVDPKMAAEVVDYLCRVGGGRADGNSRRRMRRYADTLTAFSLTQTTLAAEAAICS